MKKFLAKTILSICGWKIVITNLSILTEKKYILIAAPHTSAWDFVVGKLVYMSLGLESKFFIKHNYFKGIIKSFLIYIGGVPINRNNPREAVMVKNAIKEVEEMRIIITPEGTRSPINKWHNGFYSIAKGAKIPVFIGVLDFKQKKCSLGEEFSFTSNFNEDMQQLYHIYDKSQAKHPDKFLKHGEERK